MDLKELFILIEKFEKSGLSELSLKRNGEEVCLKKPSALIAAVTAPPRAAPLPEEQKAAGAQKATDIEVIRAPLVGTFYRAAAADAHPFVEKGDRVKKGQTLCILEAMKLMNEFQAEFDLEVVSILIENGRMVEFGAPLFEVRRA